MKDLFTMEHIPPLGLEESLRRGELHAVQCPSREVLKDITSLWGVLILIALRAGTHRYSELRRKAPGVSEKMLSQTLRVLESDGFITRTSYDVVPPHVIYDLTALGLSASDELSSLVAWIEKNLPQIIEARQLKKKAEG